MRATGFGAIESFQYLTNMFAANLILNNREWMAGTRFGVILDKLFTANLTIIYREWMTGTSFDKL